MKWLSFRQLRHSWFYLNTEMHQSEGNDLNFLHGYSSACLPLTFCKNCLQYLANWHGWWISFMWHNLGWHFIPSKVTKSKACTRKLRNFNISIKCGTSRQSWLCFHTQTWLICPTSFWSRTWQKFPLFILCILWVLVCTGVGWDYCQGERAPC